MKQTQCPICKKWIEGFTMKDLKYKLLMHSLVHRDRSTDEDIENNYKEVTDNNGISKR